MQRVKYLCLKFGYHCSQLLVNNFRHVCYFSSTYFLMVYIYNLSNTGVERSFSAMNHICSRLRQRLTSEHLAELLMVAQEGPEQPTKNLLEDIVYDWHGQRSRRLHLHLQPLKYRCGKIIFSNEPHLQ